MLALGVVAQVMIMVLVTKTLGVVAVIKRIILTLMKLSEKAEIDLKVFFLRVQMGIDL